MSLIDRALAGDERALARLATLIENEPAVAVEAMERIYPHSGNALVVGITGPPGAGKSSLVNALIGPLRERGHRVGVIAVDPTSPVSGGATLGDRIRMLDRYSDRGVFIRSLAAREGAGGLAPATAQLIHLLDACGYDRILVETVGIGQSDIAVTRLADVTVLLQVPGSGDGVQAMKAGILELADIYVVHKADLPGADALARDLRAALDLGHERDAAILRVSSESGAGIAELADAIEERYAALQAGNELAERRAQMAEQEIMLELDRAARQRLHLANDGREALAAAVAARRLTPVAAARSLLEG